MTDPTTPGVRLEADGPIARITLDRPEQHNALRAEDVVALHRFLEQVEDDPSCRVVLLTGAGQRTFCAGAALEQMESGEMSGRIFDRLTDRLVRLDRPTVCMLNGNVYGGGAELALCCDFRIGTTGVRLSVPAARLGVCYPVGGLRRYVHRLGHTAATRILLAAEELDADELLRIGYLTHRVEPGQLRHETRVLCQRLASLAPLAIRAMKRIMAEISEGSLDLEGAEKLVDRVAASADVREGVRAARKRRAPDFEGR